MNIRFLLVMLLSLIHEVSYTQELPNIIPPSPEATSLGKFIDIPVSHYTGLPNINIPLYEIDLDNIKIPISLSYHAKGIRVEEIASRVGIGWALNSGGVISRQIRGSDDSGPSNTIGYLEQDFYTTFFDNTTVGESQRQDVYSKVLLNEIDLIPDQFIFNFMGYSGKFIFDQRTKLPILQKYSDLDIQPIWFGNKIDSWIVTTPEGYKGYFGKSKNTLRSARDTENIILNGVFDTALSTSPGQSGTSYSSWYLLDVIAPNGEAITYTYGYEEPIYYRRNFDKVELGIPHCYFSQVKPKQHQVKEIIFSKGKIKFIEDTTNEREDLNNAYALDEIEIRDNNDTLIKSYKFDYIYTTKAVDNNILPILASFEPQASKRMFLNSITTYDKNKSVTLPPYKFYYDPTVLPNRFSNSQDMWGFYNGENNGYFLTFFDYGTVNINREVNIIKSQAGILNKIEYPTGGSIIYHYEHNKAIPPIYFQNLFFPNNNPSTSTSKQKGLGKSPAYYNYTEKYYETEEFTISNNLIIGSVESNVGISPAADCSETQATVNCNYTVQLVGSTSTTYNIFIGQHNLSSIGPGNYKLRVIPKNPSTENPEEFYINPFHAIIKWNEQTVNEQDEFYASGKRVSKIVLDDANGNTIIKEYEYKNPTTDKTSGKIFSLPMYYWIGDSPQNPIIFTKKYGARPGSPLTYEQGNHEGYEYVTEYQIGTKGKSGKTEYHFTTIADGGEFYEFPYTLATDNEWLRGKPIDIIHYKKSKGIYTKVQSIHNEYKYADSSTNSAILSFPLLPATNNVYEKSKVLYRLPLAIFYNQDETYGDSDEYNEYITYYHTSGTQHLFSSKTINYFDNLEFTTETQYFYDYTNHYQLSSSKMFTSNSKPIITKNYYPDDVGTIGALGADDLISLEKTAIDRLKVNDLHRIGTPVQIETYIDKDNDGLAETNELVSTQRTNYKDWGNNIVLPKDIQSLKGVYNNSSNTLEDRITYHDYDDKGNPIEVSKTGGSHIYYIWGYSQQYPIAKLENFTSSQAAGIQGTINAAIAASNNDDSTADENALRTALNNLRNAASGAMVTTYTYDPLIGVTSMTDPKGYTMYYEYDEFNRLKQVKDADGKILSKNEYHYKGQ